VDAASLTDVEHRLFDAFRTGDWVKCEGEPVRAEVLRALLLGPGSDDNASVRLTGARITGQLQLGFATVAHPLLLQECVFDEAPDFYWARMDFVQLVACTLPGVRASNVHVARHFQLSRSTIDGEVRMSGSKITGGLLLDGVKLSSRGTALTAERLELGGDLVLVGAQIKGVVRLYQSVVGGDLSFDGASITVPQSVALRCDSLTVSGGMYGRDAKLNGELSMRHSRVSGAVTFTGAQISNPDGVTLRADRVNIEGGLWLGGPFRSEGMIRLVSAEIGRGLVLANGTLANAGATALLAEGARIDGGLDARELTATGTIDLRESTISGPVQFRAAKLSAPSGRALDAARATIRSTFGCNAGFVADGQLRFSRAVIGDILSFHDASLTELRCWRTTTPELDLKWTTPPESLDLRHCHAGVLSDLPGNWPKSVRLDGFQFDAVETLAAQDRLALLQRDTDGYLPQPYEQLAAVCRRLGHDDDARTVLLTKQRKRTSAQPRLLRLWGLAQDVMVGYGYRPLRALLWLLFLLTVGTVAFTYHPPVALGAAVPAFQPAVYTADVLLPLIDLHQETAYQPGDGYQWLMYGLMAAGWILVTTVAAGVARSVRRD
jgi:hypothetical protein